MFPRLTAIARPNFESVRPTPRNPEVDSVVYSGVEHSKPTPKGALFCNLSWTSQRAATPNTTGFGGNVLKLISATEAT